MSDAASDESDVGERLLFECLELHAKGGGAAVDALLGEHPLHATRVRGELELLRRAGLLEPHADGSRPEAEREAFPERLGEFRLLERLGGGGMGVVYRALQEPLSREVALKLIRPEHLYFPGSRERFRREVLAVARMQHPGIVPVHTVGEEHGIPYFAMELIDGCTLADVLARLRGRDPTTLRARDLRLDSAERSDDGRAWIDACLVFAREIAEALDHAHSRGVLHRDVKPSNIAVTRSGRGMLLDFGLASVGESEHITRSGSQPGSLPYMSPEQVRGELDIDARTDVYALGIVLFEMLTLRAAFGGPHLSADLLRARIRAGVELRPRALNPAIARDVEIVCLKALAVERARRYDSATDFARDLGHLLRHEPIEARVAGPWLRALRWSQRHTALSGALAVALVLGIGAAAVVLRQQHTHTSELRVQRDLARQGFDDTRALATSLLFEVDEAIKNLAGSTPAREMIVRRALTLFEKLDAVAGSDPKLESDLALAHVELGNVLGGGLGSSLGDPAGAREQYRMALAIYDELLAEDPANQLDRLRRASALLELGTLDEFEGHVDEALAAYAQALEAGRALVSETPDDLASRQTVGRALHDRASALSSLGRTDEALTAARESLLVFEQLAAEPREQSMNRHNVMSVRATLSRIWLVRGERAQAERELDLALEICDQLVREEPGNNGRRAEALEMRWKRTRRWFFDQRYEESLELARTVRDEIEALRDVDPRNAAFTRLAVGAHQVVGMDLLALGQDPQAEGELETSLALANELQRAAWDARIEWDVCTDLRFLSQARRQLGELDSALALCAELEARSEAYFARSADVESRSNSVSVLTWTQSQIAQVSDASGALDAVADAVAKLELGARAAPNDNAAQIARATGQLFLARVAFVAGEKQRARIALEAAVAALTSLRESGVAEHTLGALGIHAFALLAQQSLDAGDPQSAAAACERLLNWAPSVWNSTDADLLIETRLGIALPLAISAARRAGRPDLAEAMSRRLAR